MLQYYIDFWKNYTNFSGRSSRAAFWTAMLIHFLLWVAGFFLMLMIPVYPLIKLITILAQGYTIALLIPLVALCVRRLHDIGKSGWWYLVGFVPLVGSIVLIVWYCREGDHGANAYGPDPKEMQIL